MTRPNYYRVAVRTCGGLVVEIECTEVIKALGFGFNLGNALKYLWRQGRKSPDRLDDLHKAATYVGFEIADAHRVAQENGVSTLRMMQDTIDSEVQVKQVAYGQCECDECERARVALTTHGVR